MQGAAAQIQLPAALDLAAAEGVLDMLRGAPPTCVLDASSIEVLTLPCMQVILAALKTHPTMSVAKPSAAFVAAFQDLALDWRGDGQADAAVAGPEAAAQADMPAAEPETMAQADLPAAEPDAVAQADVQETPSEAAKTTDEAAMTKRILTIDDSRTIRDMLNLTLSEAGYEVLTAVDGQDGIDVLDKERVDLVITDINMPKMDGYGVIRHMRGKAELMSTPVLVLTTESEAEKRNIAREAGATGWMVKPFDPARLIATINKVAP